MILVRYTLIIQKDIAKKIATNALRFVLAVQLNGLHRELLLTRLSVSGVLSAKFPVNLMPLRYLQ